MAVKNNVRLRHQSLLSAFSFTLVELLIVVAIIAILAAIAIPNLLEAQVRAKASRAKNDMRTIGLGLEAYRVDNNDYPPDDGVFNVVPIEITTPVAYLTNSRLVDPFAEKENDRIHGELVRYYSYFRIISFEQFMQLMDSMFGERPPGSPAPKIRLPAIESIDHDIPPGRYNPGALERYGLWRLVSNGPDRKYIDEPDITVLQRFDITYDPTNGTISKGNIFRTQKQTAIQR